MTKPPDGALDGVVAGCYFREPLPAAIKALKYRHTRAVASELVRYLVLPLRQIPASAAPLVPVPLHSAKLRKRGYNQATVLAQALARQTRREATESLRRTRNTPTQTELHRTERFTNVAGAFEWRGAKVPPAVILVDDVLTTGATLNAAAEACRAAGVRRVWGITVARRE